MKENNFIFKPLTIVQDRRLTSLEQDYLCLIASLQNARGCTASNRYFADYFGVSRERAVQVVGSLREKGFVASTEKKQGGKTVERTILIIDEVSKEVLLSDGKETLPLVSKESPAGLVRKPALDSKDSWDPITKLKQSNITKTFRPNSIEFRLAEILFDLIKGRKSDFKKPNLQVWVKDIDRMIRLDKRTPDRIEAVIRWCQQDDFWQNNILSPGKLRDKFDQLDLKMQSKTGGSVNTKLPPKPPTCFRCRLPATKQFPHKSGPIGMCSECYKHLSSAPDFVTHKGKTIKKWAIDKGQLEVMIEKQKAKTGRRQTCINPVAVESKVGVECYA